MQGYVILSKPQNIIREFIGKPIEHPCTIYRVSDFVIKHIVQEGILYYSSLTGLLILVYNFEQAYSTLIEERILVPEEEDEKCFVDKIRKVCHQLPFEENPCKDYWILTTTYCNARCFYCFESGYKRMTMTIQTAEKVAEFIQNNKNEKHITLHWYGGEPLLNISAIDKICYILKSAGIKFNSEITTNGYLFTRDLVKRVVCDWNLTKVFITIDGPENVYNKTKNYVVFNSDNAFNIVMSNIDVLVNTNIKIVIRTNIGLFNMYEVQSLYDYLIEHFYNNENVSIYPHMIINPPKGNMILNSTQRKEIYRIIDTLKESWKQRSAKKNTAFEMPGFITGRGLEFSGKQLVIKPDGELAVHLDLFDDDHFGSVFSGFKIDYNRLNQYLKEEEQQPICHNCPIYPTCFKRKIVFSSNICTEADLNKCLNRTNKNIMHLYELLRP